MKFLHTGDLHIGKRFFEASLMEDQREILGQITRIAMEDKVDAVVIAGDVYDRAVPSTEAVELLDDFLTTLSGAGIPVLMISGNHDSGERVAFADRILEHQGIYICGHYDGSLKSVPFQDEWGTVRFVFMPFVKPAVVGAQTSAQAVERMMQSLPEDFFAENERAVMITHYFVTGETGEMPELSDSETTVNVGGLDNVPASLFSGFSYTALGHIHKPQRIGEGNVYYAGAPLKYSFSEAKGEKYVNLVELGQKNVSVTRKALKPLREVRCVRGKLEELLGQEAVSAAEQAGLSQEDYLQVTLTDSEELIDPMGTLRSVYPNVLQILMEKNAAADETEYESRLKAGEHKSITELFADFYEMLKGEKLDERRREIVAEAAKEAEGH